MTTEKHVKRTSKKAKKRSVRRDHTFRDLLRKGKGAGSTGPRKQKE